MDSMDLTPELEEIVSRLIDKYGIDRKDATETVEFSVSEYRRLKNDYKTSLSDYDSDVLIWIKKASYEIIDRNLLGIIGGLSSYSENGYSFTSSGGILSSALESELVANVGFPE